MMPLMLPLKSLFLCPGDESGAHVTDNANCCGCGNCNLVSLGRILDRESTVVSMIDMLVEEHPELKADLIQYQRVKDV